MNVACVENHPLNLRLVKRAFESADWQCHSFAHARELIVNVRKRIFDLYVISARLPDIKSEELILWLRHTVGPHAPITVLVPDGDDELVVRLLSVGADCCVSSSAGPNELAARVAALIRRTYPFCSGEDGVLESGPYVFDIARKKVSCSGEPLGLSAREFSAALFLFRNIDRLVPRDCLETLVWGQVIGPGSRALDTLVSRLRIRLRLNPTNGYHLTAVHSHGFRLTQLEGLISSHARKPRMALRTAGSQEKQELNHE
jgi:DNA-binding response OmpR family regulator